MRHLHHTAKLGRTSSHKRCMLANMLKSLIKNETIETTVDKARELRRHADKLITLAKKNDLAARRKAIAELMIRFNPLTPKMARSAREGDNANFNLDRTVINKLFDELGPRFANRAGGYTRVVKGGKRIGDNATVAIVEFLAE